MKVTYLQYTRIYKSQQSMKKGLLCLGGPPLADDIELASGRGRRLA